MSAPGANNGSEDSGVVPPPASRWKTRVALPALLLTGFLGLFASTSWEALSPVATVEAIPVVERPGSGTSAGANAGSAASSANDAVAVQAAGWLEPSPWPTYVAALTDGVVAEVLFLEGDHVTAGQVLARLVGDDAHLILRRAEADLAAAEVHARELVEKTRSAEVSEATVREMEASLALARTELRLEQARLVEAEKADARAARLIAEGSISDAEQITAETSAETQRARVQGARDRIALLEAQQERARAEARAARRALELRTDETLQLALARVAVDEARLRVERLEIRAPHDGVVMRRPRVVHAHHDLPPRFGQSAHVAHLYKKGHLQVRVDVPIADAARIFEGQRAEVVVEVLPGRTFAARVSRVTALASVQKNTLEVKVVLDDPAVELKPDMLARVRFYGAPSSPASANATSARSETPAGGMAVYTPQRSLTAEADRRIVWVVGAYDGKTGQVQPREVTTAGAPAEDGWIEVSRGLRPGDLVVTRAPEPLRPGQRVRVAHDHEVSSWQ